MSRIATQMTAEIRWDEKKQKMEECDKGVVELCQTLEQERQRQEELQEKSKRYNVKAKRRVRQR